MMSKIALFGGTFDPIHNGHLMTAVYLIENRDLDKIIFIPSFISPHKIGQTASESNHRLNMINLAFEDYPKFECSDFEIRQGEISYTYKTLLELRKQYAKIELIIGFDNLVTFTEWKYPEKIIELAKLVVLKRKIDEKDYRSNKYFAYAEIVDSPIIEISSTQIRERVATDKNISPFVPHKVKEYIYKEGLYKNKDLL